jgi:hypothetical protein
VPFAVDLDLRLPAAHDLTISAVANGCRTAAIGGLVAAVKIDCEFPIRVSGTVANVRFDAMLVGPQNSFGGRMAMERQ